MFIMTDGILGDAKELAKDIVAQGLTRGELPFSPGKPLVIDTDSSKVGKMTSFQEGGVKFYVGFE